MQFFFILPWYSLARKENLVVEQANMNIPPQGAFNE